MTITTAVIRQAANTSTGTQDFTSSGFGTAKAAIFLFTSAVTDGTAINGHDIGMGFTDGTKQYVLNGNSVHNVGTTDNRRYLFTNAVITFGTPGASSPTLAQAAFSAFITDGIRINWTVVNTATLITCILLGGDDLSVHANEKSMLDTVDSVIDITDPGFEPDVILAINSEKITASGDRPWLFLTFGAVHNDGAGGIDQRFISHAMKDGLATSEIYSRISNQGGCGTISASSGNYDWYGEFSAFDSSGFSVTTRNAGGNNALLCYLALKFANHESWVGTHTTPTSTGNDAETGPSLKPQLVILGQSFNEVVNTSYSDGRAGPIGLAVFTDSAEFANSAAVEDAAGTTNNQSLSDNVAIQLPDHDGTAGLTASFVSMDSGAGWTNNYSVVDATAKLFWAVAVEEDAVAASSLFRQRQIIRGAV